MKCPECGGEPKIIRWTADQPRYICCERCGGTGVVESMTNEEWLKSLSAEELAEFMWDYTHDLITDYEHVNDPMFRHMPLKNILGDHCTQKDKWLEWLKSEVVIKRKM